VSGYGDSDAFPGAHAGIGKAVEQFFTLCRDAINPNLSVQAVEEMLIQHLLTERIFRKVFNNPDFITKNIIAHEIEQVIAALTSRVFSREEFLKKLDYFYRTIESTAATIDDYAEKQNFLNAVYEQFFQGFAVKVADTHGIVYTPQPIVEFMVRSVDDGLTARPASNWPNSTSIMNNSRNIHSPRSTHPANRTIGRFIRCG
jgi:predicted helicase